MTGGLMSAIQTSKFVNVQDNEMYMCDGIFIFYLSFKVEMLLQMLKIIVIRINKNYFNELLE